jgi:lipoprotein NlpD
MLPRMDLIRMNALLKRLLPIATALLLAGCATQRSVVVEPAGDYVPPSRAISATPPHPQVPGGSYQVTKGDTLYSIAFRNKVDFRDLAGWNNIAVPYTIWPGQVLRLSPPGGPEHPAVAAVTPVHPQPSAPPPHAQPTAPGAPVFEAVAVPASASGTTSTSAVGAKQPAAAVSTIVPVAGQPTPTHPAPPATTPIIPLKPPVAPVAAAVPATTAAPPVAAPAAVPVTAGGTRASGGVTWRWPADGSLIKRFQSGDAIPGIEIAGKSGDPIRAAADGVVVYSGNGLVGYGELIIIKHNDSLLSAYGHNRKRLVTEGQKVTAGQQIAEMGSTSAPRDELQFQIRRDGNPIDPMGYLPAH